MIFYKEHRVWKRKGDQLILFRCFELLPEGGFCVQSSDTFHKMEYKERSDFFDRQFIELLVDEAPEKRSGLFSTLAEAILDHEHCFSL